MFTDDPTRLASQPVSVSEDLVLLSESEIGSLTMRAARGAGLGWGLAEECGSAAQWLARRGFGWADAVLSRIEGARGGEISPAPRVWAAEGPVCGLRAGVLLADFAGLPEGPGQSALTLGRILDPLLLMPFVARAAATCGTGLRVEIDGVATACVATDGTVRAGADMPLGVAGFVAVTRDGRSGGAPVVQCNGQGGAVAHAVWARLDQHALGMTVPSSGASIARAGADAPDDAPDND